MTILHDFHWPTPDGDLDVTYSLSDGVVTIVTALRPDGSIRHLSESELDDLILDIEAHHSLRKDAA